MLRAIAPEAPGRDEATRVRYRHQHSLSGAMDFSRVLPPEIVFPDAGRSPSSRLDAGYAEELSLDTKPLYRG